MIKIKFPHIIHNGMKKVRETLLQGAEGVSRFIERNSQAKGSPLDQPLESFGADEGNLSGNRTEVLSIGLIYCFILRTFFYRQNNKKFLLSRYKKGGKKC